MDNTANLEARLGQSLDDLIKKQQTARKKDGAGKGRAKVKKVKATKTVKVATKALKVKGGVAKASAGQRLGGRRTAPIQVAATTKAKITQARQAAPSTSAAKGGGLQQVQFRNAAQAVAAVEMMKPLLAKAKKVIASELKGAKQQGGSANANGRRRNMDVVMQGQGGGGGRRRSGGGNRKK